MSDSSDSTMAQPYEQFRGHAYLGVVVPDNDSSDSAMALPRDRFKGHHFVKVIVGDTTFCVDKLALSTASTLFKKIFDPERYEQPKDKKYYIRGTPECFRHIVAYCHTGHYPILMDKMQLLEDKYHMLLTEAKSLKMERLVYWLEEKTYKEAVQVVTKSRLYSVRNLTLVTSAAHSHSFILGEPSIHQCDPETVVLFEQKVKINEALCFDETLTSVPRASRIGYDTAQ